MDTRCGGHRVRHWNTATRGGLGDGFCLDPTIREFGDAKAPEVAVYEPERAEWFHRNPTVFSDIVSLCAHIQTIGWREAQPPWYFVGLEDPQL